MKEPSFSQLQAELIRRVPYASLVNTDLPLAPALRLSLLAGDYPQDRLSSEQAQSLMDKPPYWAFCWASGQVLARHLLDNPELVSAKLVVDFGCGSGVAGIAAAMAGADRVIAIDSDPMALRAATLNASLNDVTIECYASLSNFNEDPSDATILVSDVFYDSDNLPLLDGFLSAFRQVIIADSRIDKGALDGVSEVASCMSHTVPDLAESAQFNLVRVYHSV